MAVDALVRYQAMTPEERKEYKKKKREFEDECFRLKTTEELSYNEIATRLKCHANKVFFAVKACAARKYEKEYDAAITGKMEDVARLDAYLKALRPACDQGHVKSIDTANRLISQRAKLLGEYVPTKHMVAVVNQQTKPQRKIDGSTEERMIALFLKLERIKAPISPSLRKAAEDYMHRQAARAQALENALTSRVEMNAIDAEIIEKPLSELDEADLEELSAGVTPGDGDSVPGTPTHTPKPDAEPESESE